MRTLSTRRFTREFPKVRHEPLTITDRGEVVGTWQPSVKKPQPVNFADRTKTYCKAPLPFTFAELLSEGKKR